MAEERHLDHTIPGQTAGDHDPHARVPLLERLQMPEASIEPVVCVLSDRTRVEDHHLGVAGVLRPGISVRLEKSGDPLRVVLVHLAPEGAHEIATGHALESSRGVTGRFVAWSMPRYGSTTVRPVVPAGATTVRVPKNPPIKATTAPARATHAPTRTSATVWSAR